MTFCDFRGNKFALLSYWFFFQIWGKERNCLPTWKSFLFARQNLYEFSWYLFSTLITIHFLRLLFLNMKIGLEELFFVGNKAKVKAHVYHAKVFDGRLTWKWSFIWNHSQNKHMFFCKIGIRETYVLDQSNFIKSSKIFPYTIGLILKLQKSYLNLC